MRTCSPAPVDPSPFPKVCGMSPRNAGFRQNSKIPKLGEWAPFSELLALFRIIGGGSVKSPRRPQAGWSQTPLFPLLSPARRRSRVAGTKCRADASKVTLWRGVYFQFPENYEFIAQLSVLHTSGSLLGVSGGTLAQLRDLRWPWEYCLRCRSIPVARRGSTGLLNSQRCQDMASHGRNLHG